MDALSDVLRIVGLTGGIFLEAEFSAPWCIMGKVSPEHCRPYMAMPAHLICLPYVRSGACTMGVEGGASQEAIAGDVVLFPRNDLHRIGSTLSLPPVPAAGLVQPPTGTGLPRIVHGGGGAGTKLICGFLGGDAQLHPLIATLPPMLKFNLGDVPGG